MRHNGKADRGVRLHVKSSFDRLRTTTLSYVTSVDYVTMIFAPSLAAALMENGLWLPLWVGIGCLACALPMAVLLPQSRGRKRATMQHLERPAIETCEAAPLLTGIEAEGLTQPLASTPTSSPFAGFFASYWSLVTGSRRFQLLLTTFFLTGFSSSTTGLLIRYFSKRYHWPFARVRISFHAAFEG